MTKYEWERELKRHIAVLPKNEQARIFDYYSEIFEDRIEAGMQEKDIIYEFGNPFDVAQKILSDYRYEDYETVRPPRFRPDRPERDEKKAEPVFESEPAAPAYTAPKEAPPDGGFQPKRAARRKEFLGEIRQIPFHVGLIPLFGNSRHRGHLKPRGDRAGARVLLHRHDGGRTGLRRLLGGTDRHRGIRRLYPRAHRRRACSRRARLHLRRALFQTHQNHPRQRR